MPQSGGGGNQIIIILLLTMVVVMAIMYFQKTPQVKAQEWDYSTVVQKVKEGVVKEVTIVDQNIRNGKAIETVNGKITDSYHGLKIIHLTDHQTIYQQLPLVNKQR